MIMYDKNTESWWQQANGTAIAGKFTGTKLDISPSMYISYKEAVTSYPDALVLSRDTGYSKSYGQNPYTGYDTSEKPFLWTGSGIDNTFPPLDRVLIIKDENNNYLINYRSLAKIKVKHINDTDIVELLSKLSF